MKKLEQMRIDSRRIGLTDKAKYEAGALDMLDAVCVFMYNFKLANGVAPLYDYVGNVRKAMEEQK